MPVFGVKKVKDYTIMPNLHLRNRQLSLRAKGLLCQMLSMPPEWNFTLQGLAYINKEGLDAITLVMHERIIQHWKFQHRENQRNKI